MNNQSVEMPASHYEILGVSHSAPLAVIDAAYDALLSECVSPEGVLIEQSYSDYANRLYEAHATLSDQVLRRQHDLFLASKSKFDFRLTPNSESEQQVITRHKLPLVLIGVLFSLSVFHLLLAWIVA
jgi:DnaJ-class molecular chaperone